MLLGRVGPGHRNLHIGHTPRDRLQHAFCNLRNLVFIQAVKDNDIVNTVEHLRAEGLFEVCKHFFLNPLKGLLARVTVSAKTERFARLAGDLVGADVRGHDDDRVFEIDLAALAVGKLSILQNLKQDVKHVRMRLFNFIEQDDRIRFSAHLFGELAALVIADIARRRTDHARHTVLLHVFGHIDTHHGVLVAEERFGQRLAQLGLADACGPEEDKRANRALGVSQADTAAADGLGDRGNRFVLPDDTRMQCIFQMEQAFAFVFGDARRRDARPAGNDFRDILFANLAVGLGLLGLPCLTLVFDFGFLGVLVAQLCRLFIILRLDRLFLVRTDGFQSVFQALEVGRRGHVLHTDTGARLIDEVNGLIRQLTARDIAHAQLNRRVNRFIGNLDTVVRFVAVAQALQDFNRVLRGRLVDRDRLEAAFERRILFDVLAILIQRGRTDDLDVAARERRLQDVRRIHRAFGRARADNHMQLINKQDHVFGVLQLVEHALNALFKLAAVLGARNHTGQIERNQTLALQVLGYVAGHNLLCQALGNRSLANARVTNERRIVLGAAGQDLDDAVDLFLTADDWVKLALAGSPGQILAEFLNDFGGAAALLCTARTAAALGHGDILFCAANRLQQRGIQLLHIYAQRAQHAQGNILPLSNQAEQQVLGADVIHAELVRGHDREFHDFLGAWGQALRRRHIGRALAGHFLNLSFHLFGRHAKFGEHLVRHAAVFLRQAGEQMLGSNIAVTHLPRGLLCKAQRFGCAFGKSILIEHKSLQLLSIRILCFTTSSALDFQLLRHAAEHTGALFIALGRRPAQHSRPDRLLQFADHRRGNPGQIPHRQANQHI